MDNTNKQMTVNAIKDILALGERIDLAHNTAMGMGNYLSTLIVCLRENPDNKEAIENLCERETIDLCAATMTASAEMFGVSKRTLVAVSQLLISNMGQPNRGEINLN